MKLISSSSWNTAVVVICLTLYAAKEVYQNISLESS